MTITHIFGIVVGLLIVAALIATIKRGTSPEVPADSVAALDALTPFKRGAWIPVTEDGDGDVTASKFAGIPWLAEGEEWPACPNCDQPMQLLLQLDLARLPARPEGCPDDGLLQLFYCTNAEDECDTLLGGWDAFSENTVVRIVKAAGAGKVFESSPVPDAFEAKRIVGWQRKDDYPDSSEAAKLGVKLAKREDEDPLLAEFPVGGDKLVGWPKWVQAVEYPECPECGQKMRFLFQIDSENNLPLMFGDMGTGHITFCPNHPNQLAFAWACY